MNSQPKRVLVTGATGTVGKPLVRKLLKNNYQIMCLVRDVPRALGLFPGHSNIVVLKCNLQDEGICNKIIEFSAPTVLHLAANLTSGRSYSDTVKLVDSNILLGTQLLNVLLKTDMRFFVNTGTFKEYYNGGAALEPTNLYGASKIAFRCVLEYYRSIHNFRVSHVVPGTIYGSDEREQKVLDLMINSLGSSEPVRLNGENTELDLIHSDDLVNFFMSLIAQVQHHPDSVADNCSFYVGEGQGRTLKALVILMEQLSGLSANILWDAASKREKHQDKIPDMERLLTSIGESSWKRQVSIEQGLRRELNKRTQ